MLIRNKVVQTVASPGLTARMVPYYGPIKKHTVRSSGNWLDILMEAHKQTTKTKLNMQSQSEISRYAIFCCMFRKIGISCVIFAIYPKAQTGAQACIFNMTAVCARMCVCVWHIRSARTRPTNMSSDMHCVRARWCTSSIWIRISAHPRRNFRVLANIYFVFGNATPMRTHIPKSRMYT